MKLLPLACVASLLSAACNTWYVTAVRATIPTDNIEQSATACFAPPEKAIGESAGPIAKAEYARFVRGCTEKAKLRGVDVVDFEAPGGACQLAIFPQWGTQSRTTQGDAQTTCAPIFGLVRCTSSVPTYTMYTKWLQLDVMGAQHGKPRQVHQEIVSVALEWPPGFDAATRDILCDAAFRNFGGEGRDVYEY